MGIIWDSSNCTVEMPVAKLDKAAQSKQTMLLNSRASLSDLRSLLGRLRHLSTCVPAAQSFVQELQSLVNTSRTLPVDAILELFPEARVDLVF